MDMKSVQETGQTSFISGETQWIVSPRPTTPPKFQERDPVIYYTDSLLLPRGLC